jgi:hypothetical protein
MFNPEAALYGIDHVCLFPFQRGSGSQEDGELGGS